MRLCEDLQKIRRNIEEIITIEYYENMRPTENKAGERKGVAVAPLFVSLRTAMPTVKGFVRLLHTRISPCTLDGFGEFTLHVTPSNPHG